MKESSSENHSRSINYLYFMASFRYTQRYWNYLAEFLILAKMDMKFTTLICTIQIN